SSRGVSIQPVAGLSSVSTVTITLIVSDGLTTNSTSFTITINPLPTIHITSVPTFGQAGTLAGTVSGVDTTAYRVAGFIYIDGGGWWSKPNFASPTVPINSGCTFAISIGTSGEDSHAEIYDVALVPNSQAVPTARGDGRIPTSLNPI